MRKLVSQRYLVRHNFVTVIGFCLACYFTYHIGFGERSLIRLLSLERGIAQISSEYEGLRSERTALESRVVRLRPGSLDRDLLEERARYVLGFVFPGEQIILGAN